MQTPVELVKQTSGLISLPQLYWELQRLLTRPDTSVEQFSAVIRLDPGLATKVLQISNGALFGSREPVETIQHAVKVLGTALIHDLVLAVALAQRFAQLPILRVQVQEFWRRGVCCGLVAKQLARQCRLLDGERLFTYGLLHEVGHLVLWHNEADALQAAMSTSREQRRPVHIIEREYWGFDYGTVGGELLRHWRLPVGMVEAAQYHFDPARAKHFTLETAMIHLAWIAMLRAEWGQDYEAFATLDVGAYETVSCTEDTLLQALEVARESLQEVLPILTRA